MCRALGSAAICSGSAIWGIWPRPEKNGNFSGSPWMCVWQSQAPAGTSKFTGVAGWAAFARLVRVGRMAPAANAPIRISRRVRMGVLPDGIARQATVPRTVAPEKSFEGLECSPCRLDAWGRRYAPRSAGATSRRSTTRASPRSIGRGSTTTSSWCRAKGYSQGIPCVSHSRAARATSRRTWGRRALLKILAAPLAIRILVGAVVILAVWSAVNWVYQVMRKPTELFFPVSGVLAKTPPETWRRYGLLFHEHSTAVITPELLAALAQVEGAGNPVARTYWRWRLTWNPFELYQPASSAVGMYQITDATVREAKRYCIHDHVAGEDGPWDDRRSCWFNGLYARVVPSHAVELTAALLDRSVANTMERQRITTATLQQKQDLAAVIHLCGARPGDAYARRGFRLTAGQRCGDHDVSGYLAQVDAMKRQFVRLAAAG